MLELSIVIGASFFFEIHFEKEWIRMKRMLAYSMITYMLFYISMNLGTFACIVLFGLRTGTDNIRDYAGLYTKDPFLDLSLDSLRAMTVCVIASTIPGISMNPILAIAQDTLF
ncbi:hypothetical protein ACJX0J_013465 [Zea mays]